VIEVANREESGFTLIELVVVTAVLGIILSSIAGAFIVVIRTVGVTQERTSQSHDAQILSFWLVPDLQSADGQVGNGIKATCTASAVGSPTCSTFAPADAYDNGGCPATYQRLSSMKLSWTDLGSGDAYSATYALDFSGPQPALRRTFSVNAAVVDSFVVVHNLEDPRPSEPLPAGATALYPVCYLSTRGKTTLHVTTLVHSGAGAAGTAQHSFTVSGQSRTPFPPPALTPPVLLASTPMRSGDADHDAKVDKIEVTFDQPVTCPSTPCDPTKWKVLNQPGAAASVDLASLTTSGSKATLTLTEVNTIDSVASTLALTMAAGAVEGPGGAAPAISGPVADGMAPVMLTARSKDAAGAPDGRLDQISVTYSESLKVVPRDVDYSLIGAPAGTSSIGTVSGSSSIYSLPVTLVTVNTAITGMTLRVAATAATDDADNASVQTDVVVGDGMAPVLTSLIADQGDATGHITRMSATFTEPASGTPSVTYTSASVTSTAITSGNSMTLALIGTPVDTSTGSYGVSGTLTDGAGNALTLTNQAVIDGVGPRLLNVATAAQGTIAAQIQVNDAINLTFSEPLSPVPAPTTITVTESGSGANVTTQFVVAQASSTFATVSMETGKDFHYFIGAALNCQVTPMVSGAAILLTVTESGCTGGTTSIGVTAPGTATPAASLRDAANNANGGELILSSRTFF